LIFQNQQKPFSGQKNNQKTYFMNIEGFDNIQATVAIAF